MTHVSYPLCTVALNIRKMGIMCFPLPFKDAGKLILPCNSRVAVQRLGKLKQKFLRDPKYFKDYCKVMNNIIDHWLVFKTLIAKRCTIIYNKITFYIGNLTNTCALDGETRFSSLFSVSNGVKQGGILSPALFIIYMDGLSTSLNSSNIGGLIGGNILNHLCYADDMCLISLFFSWNAVLVKYL